jgi:hypothetical protein
MKCAMCGNTDMRINLYENVTDNQIYCRYICEYCGIVSPLMRFYPTHSTTIERFKYEMS